MAGKRKGLGRGLNNLIPAAEENESAEEKESLETEKTEKKEAKEITKESPKENKTEVVKEVIKEVVKEVVKNEPLMVKITQIEPNENQPRKNFDENSLTELANSIRQYGMIQPIIVQKKDNYYEIIAGERRWRAAQIAGLKEVPVIVREDADQDTLELALIENIQRQDLNPIEEALAYKRLLEEYHLTQEEVADRVSKSRTAVTNAVRLLKLCRAVQEMVENGELSGGHARALIPVEDEEQQVAMAEKIMNKGMSVRETEKMVKEYLNPKKLAEKEEKQKDPQVEATYATLEEKLKSAMGTKVSIKQKNENAGTIVIEYYSLEELERLTEQLL
ncbi:MAG: ParB/RepB/Spo0J family partition protein [Lachnospiraceae bacterium]|nr:ParB/RepB/Spo0J family partition protein [Lachnospiraceae bacterium]